MRNNKMPRLTHPKCVHCGLYSCFTYVLYVKCVSSSCVSVALRKNSLARIVKFTKMRELSAACCISQTPKLTFNGARFLFGGKRSCDGTDSGAILFARCHILQHSDKNNDMLMMI